MTRSAWPPRVWAAVALLTATASVATVVAGSLRSARAPAPPGIPRGERRHGPGGQAGTVTVLNGTARTGRAAEIAARLAKHGFRLLGVGDARAAVTASTIAYRPGHRPTARAVAAALGLRYPAVHAATRGAPGGADVIVVVGPDLP